MLVPPPGARNPNDLERDDRSTTPAVSRRQCSPALAWPSLTSWLNVPSI